jgi:hypothetical protein
VLKGTIEIRVNVRDAETPIVLDWRKIRGHEGEVHGLKCFDQRPRFESGFSRPFFSREAA